MSISIAYRFMTLVALVTLLAACNEPAGDATQGTSAAPGAAQTMAGAVISGSGVTATALETSVLQNAKSGGQCALDSINTVNFTPDTPAHIGAGHTFNAVGWVVDSALMGPSQFTLVLKGQQAYGFRGASSVARPDVAASLNSQTATNAGFSIDANLGNIPAGTYEVQALIEESGNTLLCDMHRQVVIDG